MSKPESLPVEEARKKFADILDGSQFRSTHTQITRRGKAAGYVVPPEWYARATEALEQERTAPPVAPPTPARTPAPLPSKRSPKREAPREGRPLTDEEASTLAALARSRASEMQLKKLEQNAEGVADGYKDFTTLHTAMDMGLLTHDEVYAERPVSGEETSE